MILGIDFGTAKIGLAVADIKQKTQPLALSIIRYTTPEDLKRKFSEVLAAYPINAFVVGIAIGDEEKQQQFEAFLKLLKTFGQPIHFVDERRSTQAAKSLGSDDPNFKTKHDDALAAQVILESYLATHGRM